MEFQIISDLHPRSPAQDAGDTNTELPPAKPQPSTAPDPDLNLLCEPADSQQEAAESRAG